MCGGCRRATPRYFLAFIAMICVMVWSRLGVDAGGERIVALPVAGLVLLVDVGVSLFMARTGIAGLLDVVKSELTCRTR